MVCAEIMTSNPQALSEQSTVQEAATAMRDAQVGLLPVCDESKHVLGVLTDRDIVLQVVAENRAVETSVSDIMNREVKSCLPSDDIERAQQIMSQEQLSRLIVRDNAERLVGIISIADLTRHAASDAAAVQQAVKQDTPTQASEDNASTNPVGTSTEESEIAPETASPEALASDAGEK